MSTNPIKKFFSYDQTKDQSTCTTCSFIMKGKHAGNLRRHIQRNHQNEYKKILEKTNSTSLIEPSIKKRRFPEDNSVSCIEKYCNLITVNMSAKCFIDACVKLVTVNGRPLTIFKDDGVREPLMKALKITINSENIKDFVNNKADEIKTNIKADMSKKLISIKIDSASRLGKSVIGINAQYIRNGKIILRTLEMREVDDRLTGNYIKNVIIDVIQSYNLEVNQIYSVTSDNGSNMLKAAELLRSEFDVLEFEEQDEDLNDYDIEMTNSDEYGLENLSSACSNIIHFKCVAHTVHLAVSDTINAVNFIRNWIVVQEKYWLRQIVRLSKCLQTTAIP